MQELTHHSGKFPSLCSLKLSLREAESLSLSKGIEESTSLAFAETPKLIGKYDRSCQLSNSDINFVIALARWSL
jgi:hypothetical protein